MANQEQLRRLLHGGTKNWNAWRKQHPKIGPDLRGADLRNTDLSSIDLSYTQLRGASLRGAKLKDSDLSSSSLGGTDFSKANLSFADLSHADLTSSDVRPIKGGIIDLGIMNSFDDYMDENIEDLIHIFISARGIMDKHITYDDLALVHLKGANFSYADLSHADLRDANLSYAHFNNTDLSHADLRDADLSYAHFNNTDLSYAQIAATTFGDVDLRMIEGLDTVIHWGPSIIGVNSIMLSEGDIPEDFLRGVGLSNTFINYTHALVGKPIEYYSCFISYSSKDQEFVERLYVDLQSKGVRCWFAPEDLKTGDKIRDRIDQSIRVHDKLPLVLSQHSVNSSWVEFEVEAAIAKENSRKTLMLFPIRLDNAVKESPTSWAAHIRRTRHITDFSKWKQHDAYQQVFNRLLHDLKAERPPRAEQEGIASR